MMEDAFGSGSLSGQIGDGSSMPSHCFENASEIDKITAGMIKYIGFVIENAF